MHTIGIISLMLCQGLFNIGHSLRNPSSHHKFRHLGGNMVFVMVFPGIILEQNQVKVRLGWARAEPK